MSSITDKLRAVRESRQLARMAQPETLTSQSSRDTTPKGSDPASNSAPKLDTPLDRLAALGYEIANEIAKRKEVPSVARIAKRLMPLAIKDLRKIPEEKIVVGIQMLIVALGRVLFPDSDTMTVQLREMPTAQLPEETPGSSNGKTPDFGSENEGSTPSPGANEQPG